MSTNPSDETRNQADSPTQTTGPADELAAAQTRIEALEQELADARERADRYHANWQRSAADFQNWKRRTDQEKTELTRVAEGAMTLDLLRILDDFERAFQSLPRELYTLTWIEGVSLIGQKLYSLLQARGLSPIDAAGEEFDPFLHEAVLREEGAEGSDKLVVVQEFQRGYRFHDRVIRPTMVKVGPPPAEPAADAPDAPIVDAQASEAPPADPPAGSSGDPEQPVAS